MAIGFVSQFLLLQAGDPRLDTLLHAVETHYNRAQSVTLSFTETYTAQRRPEKVESGALFLRKPGRMRWDYTQPAGKTFISDGKTVTLYTPDTNQVERTNLKETEDMRAPLAFLLGKLNFYKEFRKFELRPEGADTWIMAEPNSTNLPYTRVEFLVAPDARIRRLRVMAQDHSILDFQFEREKLNPPLDSKLFEFRAPLHAQIIEGEQ